MARRTVQRSVRWSFQARLYVILQRWARLLPTARLDEHRHPTNTIGLVCAFGEQRKHLASPFFVLRSQAETGPCGLSIAGALEPCTSVFLLVPALGEQGDEQPHLPSNSVPASHGPRLHHFAVHADVTLIVVHGRPKDAAILRQIAL